MGRWTLAALVVNAILGSGIFGLPATLHRLVGENAAWIWILGAIGNGVVMLCFAEVASRFSEAGGVYLYARETLPRLGAILVGWLAFLTRLTAAAAAANLFTVNLAEFFPAAAQPAMRIGLLTVLLGGLAAINLLGVQTGSRSNNFFTAAKLVPLVIFVVAGAIHFLGDPSSGAPSGAGSAAGGTGEVLRAFLLVAFAYGGYDGALMAMGEAKNPRRDAPFALLVAMIFLAGLYTAVQLIVDASLVDPGASQRPLVEAARVFLGGFGGSLLAAGAIVSVVGYLGANFLAAPRLLFALAEHRDLPGVFGRVHPRWRTPHVAILVLATSVWAFAVYGNFEWNATLSAVCRLFIYGSTCVALLVLRRRAPGQAWFRLPGGGALALLGIAFCLLLASRMGQAEGVILAVLSSVALIHWRLLRR